jgi:hypothetical protein
MSVKPKSAFFIFLDDFAVLHRTEYGSYHIFTAAASEAWRKLDNDTKKNYEQLSKLQLQEYKINQKMTLR